MKTKIDILLKIYLFGVVFLFSGCSVFAEESVSVPYQISGEMVLGPSKKFLNAGFEYSFFNKTEKEVSDFTIVFYLFDEDGNPPSNGKNNYVFKIQATVEPYDLLDSSISLDKYLTYIPEEPYEADYLYVSNITYTDGTKWSDPFGFCLY